MNKVVPRYNRRDKKEFARTLRSRVNAYFEDKKISKTGDWRAMFKALVMFSMYFGPYALMLSVELNTYQYILGSIIMGIGVAGIGLAVMHDANHGSFSSKNWVNRLFGYSLNIIGGNSLSWRIQHNVLHHSFTNVRGLDEDLEAGNIMRFTPQEPWKPRHRYQHIYAWFLYSFMTFSWVLIKDFRRITKYKNQGLLEGQNVSYVAAIATLLVSKVVYMFYMFYVPIAIAGYSPWIVIAGFMIIHLIGGLLLAMIFQPAHIMEDHDFVAEGVTELDQCYEAHQLSTTSNFGSSNPVLTWYCGGLNYQVEHHIFPSVSHVHYPAISKIVEATAKEFGVPYRTVETFGEALSIHQRTMKKLATQRSIGDAVLA
ncbi:MAG: acyl-CoA desaturase [Flavobacteriales bacterium]|nr:acyl-CoA desaturase [Flavobacteriales bacterium]